MDIAKTYWQSDEGEQSRAALQEAFSGTNKVAGGLRSTFLAARKVWDFQLGDQSNIETTDEYVEKLATAANKVWKDAEVKESFDLVTTGSKEAIGGFTKAVQLTSSKIGQEVKNSKDFKSAVKSFTKGVGAFFGFLKKQATSNRGVPRSRTLPPSKL